MTPEKWAVRKVMGYWTVIAPAGERLPGYVMVLGGYPFGKQSGSFALACEVLRTHLDYEANRAELGALGT